MHQEHVQANTIDTAGQEQAATGPLQLLWAYPLLIALAEIATVAIGPQAGLIAHGLVLALIAAHRALARHEAAQQLALALLLAPLLRALSLAMPLNRFPQTAWYGLIALPMLLAAGLVIRRLRLSRRDLGLRPGNLLIQVMVAAGGLGLGAAAYAILQPPPLSGDLALRLLWLPTLVLVLCGGLTEELIFRGVLQAAALPALGRWALVYGALVVTVLQVGYLSPWYLLLALGASLLFAYTARWSGSILGIALAHGLANFTLLVLMPLLAANPSSPAARVIPWAMGGGTLLAFGAFGFLLLRALRQRTAPPQVAPGATPPMSELGMQFATAPAQTMRDLRRRSGLTYVQLGQRCGLPARLLAEIEYGLRLPSPEHLGQIAASLRVSPQQPTHL